MAIPWQRHPLCVSALISRLATSYLSGTTPSLTLPRSAGGGNSGHQSFLQNLHWREGCRRRRAFTLVELLVTVGIIACLVGLVLPAAARARDSGRSLVCLSNLRQMTIAARSYAQSYDGRYPIGYAFGSKAGLSYSFAWDLTTRWGPGHPTEVIPGLLWEGQGVERVQQCPSFDGEANWLSDPYTGYNYNVSYIGHGQFEADPMPVRLSAVKSPATTALFGDGEWSGGANKFMRAPFPNSGDATFSGRWAGTQGYRHLGRTNVAFCDGHAEALAGRYTQNKNGAANVGEGTGFLSPDNSMYDLE